MRDEPVYRGILGIDIEGFSRTQWTDPIRRRLRERLYQLVDDALATAQIPASQATRSDDGDGLWLLVNPEISITRLLNPLASGLARAVTQSNRQAPAAERMRLRMVVHAGALLPDAHGHAGATWNLAARLRDAQATRAVLAACSAADAVVVVSEHIYEGVVRHGYEGIDPSTWQSVWVDAKETSTRAWTHLPGQAVQPRPPDAVAAPPPGASPNPRELPYPLKNFTGRTQELAILRRLLRPAGGPVAGAGSRPAGRSGARSRSVVIAAIDGMAGIGKSALAVQLANQLADAFPDGQLYVNLQGATPGLAPLQPLDALGRLLRALGMDPAHIPNSIEEAAARFRSIVAERRLLLVLDNANDAEQVRSLLPASPTCAVLVTSRQVLATLDGAYPLHLDVLPERQALELLDRCVGRKRVAAEPQAAVAVVRLCGSLPLALRIAGARLAARPSWPVRALAERLADATGRLEELRAGELAVRASFDVSLHALTESPDPGDRAAVAVFGLLSLPDGPDLDVAAAARLVDQPQPTTHALLERLVDAQLLETPMAGRYQFHDLVRLYARQHATRRHPDSERLAALERLLGFYTATAWHARMVQDPGNQRGATADPRWTSGGLQLEDDVAATRWLAAEGTNLVAAVAQAGRAAPAIPAKLACELTSALWALFETHGYWHEGVRANQTALALARHTGDRAAQAHALNDLGIIYQYLGRHAQALACLREGLTLYRELGDRTGQATSLNRLGSLHEQLGRLTEAIAHIQQALILRRELGDRHAQASSLAGLGGAYRQIGRSTEAIACLREGLALSRELHNRWHQAQSLHGLGVVHGQLGQFTEAITSLQESLRIFGELGHRSFQADNLEGLGVVYRRLGQLPQAITSLQACLALRRELGDRRGQAEALRELGDALQAAAQHQQARAAWQESLAIRETLQASQPDELRGRLATPSPQSPSRPTAAGAGQG